MLVVDSTNVIATIPIKIYFDFLIHYLPFFNYNNIVEIKGIEGLKISQLDISYNLINEVKGLDKLPNLNNLNIKNNPIIDREEFLLNRDVDVIRDFCIEKNQLIKGIIGDGEDETAEYKESFRFDVKQGRKNKLLKEEVTKAVCALLNKFGGEIIWHASDTESFNPARFNKYLTKEKYGIERKEKVIVFFGTPRPWKGLEDLIIAVSLVKNQDVILMVVGFRDDNYCRNLFSRGREILGRRFVKFGLHPFESVPEFLTMSDLIVIPQRKNPATVAQIPAKIFDAMAMAKPIIATRVSDLPEILEDCGQLKLPHLRTGYEERFDLPQNKLLQSEYSYPGRCG